MTSASASPLSSRVAVVGGGFAGLAAARRLARAGVRVSLFERSGRLGGLAMTLPLGDTEIEKYYHHWFTSDRDVLGLVAELGLADRLRWISPVMGMFTHGAIYRFTSPADLLRFRPFSLAAKLRFGLVTLFLQRYPRREPFERVTAAAWLRRFAGREVYDTVWGPMLRAKFGRNAESISMAWIWSKMRLRGTSRTAGGTKESLGYLAGGFGALARAMAADATSAGAHVCTAERVKRIRRAGGGGLEVETARRRERFDAVISTVAPPLLAELAPDLPAAEARRYAGIEHAAILCTMLVLRRPLSAIYWLNVGDRAIPFGGVIEHTNFLSPREYGGRRVVYLSHYVYPDEPIWTFEAERVLEGYGAGLRRIQPAFGDDWIEEMMCFRDRFAQPIVTVDYPCRMPTIETAVEDLYTATMSQIYPEDRGTNYAVRIGHEAADLVLERLVHPRVEGERPHLASLPRS